MKTSSAQATSSSRSAGRTTKRWGRCAEASFRSRASGFGLLLVGAFTAGRYEALVGDDAFLRSMIPHHSRAIHMCQEADLRDAEIRELCRKIIDTQRDEIAEMYEIIERRG